LNDYQDYDALGLAELVRSGEVSAEELLEAAISQVERHNPAINALVVEMYEHAEASIAAGLPQGPFTGVPFLLKDLRATFAGVPTSSGSRLFAHESATHDSELVIRQKQAGLVIFGKTNTSEFGCCPSTEGTLYGATRNPWDTRLSAGGSSGGSAAAVAAGFVPMAHGSDGGGSIRIPAACCGLFGFKTSRGVNPAGPSYGEAWNGLSAEHAITRSVRDSAALLDATQGPSPGDPYCGPRFERPFMEELGRGTGKLRIAVQRQALTGAVVHQDCIDAVNEAVKLLESLGHTVEEAVPSYDHANIGSAFTLLIAANVQAAIDDYASRHDMQPGPEHIDNVIQILARIGTQNSAAAMAKAVWQIHKAGRDVAPFFAQYDVLLSPVVATPPPRIGTLDTSSADIEAYLKAVFEFIPFTSLANIAGLPAMSVPLYWNRDQVPIGVHFMSGYGADPLLFQLAGQLEKACSWHSRRPILPA
jgi:amidase